jgi:uncharacterized membrane protein YfcA
MKSSVINLLILFGAIATLVLYHNVASDPRLLSAIGFLVLGYAVGAYGTMVGAGGGFLIVPFLLLAYHVDHAHAAGTGLAVVFLNAASGTISYARQKRIDYRAGFIFAIACLPGSIAGAFMAELFTGRLFNITFGVVLLAISVLLVWRPAQDREHVADEIWEHKSFHITTHLSDSEGQVFKYRYNWLVGVILSFFVGFASSILGIGGGIIHVPVLVYLLGFPPHMATATSHFILAITAGVGATTHMALGHVLLWPAALLGIGVIGGAQIGAIFGKRVHGTWLLRMLAIALVAVAIRLFLK